MRTPPTIHDEAASTPETSVNFYQNKGAATQKTAIFTLAAVRTSNLPRKKIIFIDTVLLYVVLTFCV
jgi:hypothetical protein